MVQPPMHAIRRPGSPWRLLVHEYVGIQADGTRYGTSHDVTNDQRLAARNEATAAKLGLPGLSETVTLPPTCEFDELVVGRWIHLEQLDTGTWWMDIGGLIVHVTADREGRPTRVMWELDRRDGVTYDDGSGR